MELSEIIWNEWKHPHNLRLVRWVDQPRDVDKYGRDRLQLAAKMGRLDLVEMLLRTGDYDINYTGYCGNTPLLWACMKNHEDVIIYLLQNGADPNIGNWRRSGVMLPLTHQGRLDLIQLVYQFSQFPIDINGYLLFEAVKSNRLQIIEFWLDKLKELFGSELKEELNKRYDAPHLIQVENPIFKGLSTKDISNITPLQLAMLKGEYESFMLIFDVLRDTSHGATDESINMTLIDLKYTVYGGNVEILKVIEPFLSLHMDITKEYQSITELLFSVRDSFNRPLILLRMPMLEYFIEHGVHFNFFYDFPRYYKFSDPHTPLYYTVIDLRYDLFNLIINTKGTDLTLDDLSQAFVHRVNSMYIIPDGWVQILKGMMEHQIDITSIFTYVHKYSADTFLHKFARSEHYEDFFCFLLELGADPNIRNKDNLLPIDMLISIREDAAFVTHKKRLDDMISFAQMYGSLSHTNHANPGIYVRVRARTPPTKEIVPLSLHSLQSIRRSGINIAVLPMVFQTVLLP